MSRKLASSRTPEDASDAEPFFTPFHNHDDYDPLLLETDFDGDVSEVEKSDQYSTESNPTSNA